MQLLGKHKISLLAFDLDGTLLNSAGQIDARHLNMLRGLMNEGVKVTLCSGRMPFSLLEYVQQLDLRGPYVASNGGLVVNSLDGSIMYSKSLTAQDVDKLCAYSHEAGLHLCLQALEGVYYSPDNPLAAYHIAKRSWEKLGISVNILSKDYGYSSSQPVFKVSVYVPQGDYPTRLVKFLEGQPGITYAFSDKKFIEINPWGTGKGAGIEQVAAYYGIPLKEVCVFGDYDNDIPSFERAGISVAMGNASENLKARAMYVTDTNDNDGIGKALTALDKAGCF